MNLTIPDELVKASGLSEAKLLQELVIVLFQQDKLSLGKARFGFNNHLTRVWALI